MEAVTNAKNDFFFPRSLNHPIVLILVWKLEFNLCQLVYLTMTMRAGMGCR